MSDNIDQLAIECGTAVFPEGPPVWPRPSEAIRMALEAAYSDGSWGRYQGQHSERLHALLTDLTTSTHVWPCSSGTIAIELALRGLRVQPGDEVILAAYDFPGNFRAIEAIGARPVLVDLALDSWTLDVEQVAAAVSPQTKAVISSHLHGSLADMRKLRELADQHGISIVEDACQTPGAMISGKPAGSWGDCGVFSFGGSKLLTAGRGGAIVTSREDVFQRIKICAERGNDAFPLSELQAAVLLPQIRELNAANAQRRQSVEQLLLECSSISALSPLGLPNSAIDRPAFYKLPWQLNGNNDACDAPNFEQLRAKFIAAIQAEGVAMDAGFRGFARRSGQRCRVVGNLPHAKRAAAGTVILHHPVLLEAPATIARVALALKKVAGRMIYPSGA